MRAPFSLADMFRLFAPRSLPALVAVLLVGAAPVRAQSIPSPYRYIEERQEAGIFAGVFDGPEGRFELGPKPAPAFGARYGLGLAGPLGVEGIATFVPTTRNVVNPGRDEGDRVVDEAESSLVFIEARFRLALTGRRTWRGIQPFFLVGAGLGFDAQGAQAEEQNLAPADRFEFGTKFLGSGGAGFRYLIGDRYTVRLDASFLLYQLETPGGFADPARNLGDVPENEWVTGRTLALSLAYRF